MVLDELQARARLFHVTLEETLIDRFRRQFLAFLVGNALDVLAELDLQATRQVQPVVLVQDIGDAALPRLRVDADDRLIGAADILRVDRQVRHFPVGIIGDLDRLHALVDGILVGPRESGVDQFANVRMTLRDHHLVGVFVDFLDTLDLGAVELRIDALGIHVQRQRDDVDIAGALAVTEQRAFDAVCACHQAQFGRSDPGAAIIMWVQRDDDVFAIVDIAAHPFDLVRIDVRRRHFDGGWQVDDQLVVGRRLHFLDHRVADLERDVQLGAGKALGRILESVTAAGLFGHVGDHLGGIDGDLLDAGDVLVEDNPALEFRSRVIEVDDRLDRAFQRLEGARDQLRAALDQHLQRHVSGHIALFDAPAGKIEIGL